MTWDLSIEQKEMFLELMKSLGAHTVYHVPDIANRLRNCGIPVTQVIDNEFIQIGDEKIQVITPEWGDPGIYAPNVLTVLIKHYGFEITSNLNGRGFVFMHKLQQLAYHWGLNKNYL